MKTKIFQTILQVLACAAAIVLIFAVDAFISPAAADVHTAAAILFLIVGLLFAKTEALTTTQKLLAINLPLVGFLCVFAGVTDPITPIFSLTGIIFSAIGLLIRRKTVNYFKVSCMVVGGIIYAYIFGFVALPRLTANNKMTVTDTASPSFELVTLSNETLSSNDLKDQVVVLNFWATWCSNCVQEMPQFNTFAANYKGNDRVKILAVTMDAEGETLEKAKAYMNKKGYDIPLAFDKNMKTYQTLKLEDIPATVVIDKRGHVRMIHTGFGSQEDYSALLDEQVQSLLNE